MRSLDRTPPQGSTSSQSPEAGPAKTSPTNQTQQQQNAILLSSPATSKTISIKAGSFSPAASLVSTTASIDPSVLVYHESARSIVFRDHLRRAAKKEQESQGVMGSTTKRTVTTEFITELADARRDAQEYTPPDDMIGEANRKQKQQQQQQQQHGKPPTHAEKDEQSDSFLPLLVPNDSTITNCFQPSITPLPKLALGHTDELQALLKSPTGEDGNVDPIWTVAEREVVELFAHQQALLKTIKNTDWTPFLHRFQISNARRQNSNLPTEHDDIGPRDATHYPWNSFVTSCSLLPPFGKKMRAYGSPTAYTAGVVFALPRQHHTTIGGDHNNNSSSRTVISEDEAATTTKTWSWPAGYSAKTEFNIDGRGDLINGRKEALVSLSQLRDYNRDYLTKEDHMISGRLVKGGLKTVPYNEIYVRVGGLSRIVNGKDVVVGEPQVDELGTGRSFDKGLGLPVALFVRTATYGHLISLIRTRARLAHVLGENRVRNIPLLFVNPDRGVRVFTEIFQAALLKDASQRLNPFQNPTIAHKTTIDSTGGEEQLEQKLEELIDLDDNVRKLLTPEECARIAGGFGATDESVAVILKEAMLKDKQFEKEKKSGEAVDTGEGHMLQDIVNEGLAAAVRSGDYYTSRQLLILYSLVASKGMEESIKDDGADGECQSENGNKSAAEVKFLKHTTPLSELKETINNTLSTNLNPPPPPPLDTDRLRGATNSDGLLAVLGAAQVLKAMQDGSAKKRTSEVILALDEWIEHGEQSMAFRLASWRDQRAAQGDLKIAMAADSSFMAFVSNKAISNRKAFVSQLKQAVQSTDFSDARLIAAIEAVLSRMHSPCLRLELLQYVLGLDNRYSVAHVVRSVELAKTCLGIAGLSHANDISGK